MATFDSVHPQPEEPDVAGTMFDPANFQPVVLIQLARCYDVLMNILATSSPQGKVVAEQLAKLHEAGITLAPAPAFRFDEESGDVSTSSSSEN